MPWDYDQERYRRLDEARRREQRAMLDYQGTSACRMSFLRAQLDDPELRDGQRCGRCDNCTGSGYSSRVDAAEVALTVDRLRRPGVELARKRQWPTGLGRLGLDMSGRITDGPAPGRAIGRLTDLGWGARLRQLLDGEDTAVPDDVVRAAVQVLAAWDWDDRPVAVMGIDSVRHPKLIGSLVERLAQLGRLTNLGTLAYAPRHRPVAAANSAYRVAALNDAFAVSDPAAVWAIAGPVLLVDDVADTGWTLTMAARTLRAAGVPAVLPFAVASLR